MQCIAGGHQNRKMQNFAKCAGEKSNSSVPPAGTHTNLAANSVTNAGIL